jgi:hypothetical protein
VKALLGGGKPLPGGLRTEMEQRFGADFGDVRLIREPEVPIQKATTLGYTRGNQIFLTPAIEPTSDLGRQVLSHELVHVQQQRIGATTRTHSGHGALEAEAWKLGESEGDGDSVSESAPLGQIQMLEKTSQEDFGDEDIARLWSPETEERVISTMVNDYEEMLRVVDWDNQKRYERETFPHWYGRYDPYFPGYADPPGRFYQGVENVRSFQEELRWKQRNIKDPVARMKAMHHEYRYVMRGGFEKGLVLASAAIPSVQSINRLGGIPIAAALSSTLRSTFRRSAPYVAGTMIGLEHTLPAVHTGGGEKLISQPLQRPTIAEAPTVVARPAITQSTQPSAKMQPKANEAAAVLAKEMPTAKPPGTVSASMQTSDKTYSSVLAAKASQSDSFPNEPPTRGRQMPDGSVKPYVKPLTIDERQEADKMQRRSLGLAQEGPAKVFVFEPMNPTKTSKLGFVIKEKKADGSPKIAEFTGVVDRGEAPLAGAKPAAQVGSVEREKNGIRMGGAAALEPTYDYPGGEAPDIVTVQTVDKKGSITIKTVQPNFSSLQQRESDPVLNRAWKAIFGKSWSKDASHVVGLANRGTNMPYNLAQDRPNFQNRGKKGMETWRKLEGKFTTFSKENPDLGRVEYARTPSKDNKILADRITAYDQNGKIVFDMERRGTELNDFLTQKSTPTP